MIRLNVFIRTTESNRAEILSVAKELVTASLKDEGCIAYDIFESATRQDVLMRRGATPRRWPHTNRRRISRRWCRVCISWAK